MNSNFVPMKPNCPPPRYSDELRRKINEQIDNQIELYDLNGNGKEDDYIKVNLELIKKLAENIENSDDILFIEKIISTFLEIMDTQRKVIDDLSVVYTQLVGNHPIQNNYVSSCEAPTEGYANDKQVTSAFLNYMYTKEEKQRSSFTINDYLLRVKLLWERFVEEYKGRTIPETFANLIAEEFVSNDQPLLKAYLYIDVLSQYLALKMEKNSEDRNLANARSALNMFGKALHGKGYEKVKVVREANQGKDFSKYSLNGKSYGKSRLVLAVVQQYVEDYNPSTFEELEAVFPSSLQGSLGVVRRIQDVPDKYKGIGLSVKRYFTKEDEIIHLSSGEQGIVCSQWGISNLDKFIDHVMNDLGFEIGKIEL